MMRLATMILVLGLLVAGSAPAEQTREQHKVDATPVTQLPAGAAARSDGCSVGNPNAAYWTYGNWIMGGETYAYLVNPPAEGCGCSAGFKLSRVYMMMQFGDEDAPVTFNAFAGLAEAVWDPARGVYVPGQDYCTSPTWAISAGSPGLYDIYIDMDGGCPCASTTEPYFVTFHLPDGFTWWPSALEDNDPQTGLSWYNSGFGWYDLVADFGWWGKNIMHADLVCCDAPVHDQTTSWGSLKSTWR